jgi:hypothetical protein
MSNILDTGGHRKARLLFTNQGAIMNQDKALREHVVELLEGKQAHVDFDSTINELPKEHRGKKPDGAPYTPWQLLEHMRIAQRDILEFSRNAKHVSPEWPEGYWPTSETPADEESWNKSVSDFRTDLQAMKDLAANPSTDLYSRIPHGTGQTILREALLVADHNAYHLGQIVLLERLLRAIRDGE